MKDSEKQAGKAKILTVDDDSIINLLYDKHLSSQYEVFSATSGEEAIDTYHMVQPDLILLDVEMALEFAHNSPKHRCPVGTIRGSANKVHYQKLFRMQLTISNRPVSQKGRFTNTRFTQYY